jgi:16S rRNA (cytosine1402-N4)-methyltransferase
MSHIPVLLETILDNLNPSKGEFIIDGTVNGGGHAEKFVERIGPSGKFLGVDLDEDMLSKTRSKLSGRNIFLIQGNYADLPEILDKNKLGKADALLLDLGFSSNQLESGRGFAFSGELNEPILMTYDKNAEPLFKILQKLKAQELEKIIREYGGERMAGRIAKAIKGNLQKIKGSHDLAKIVSEALPRSYERGRIHPATRTFQALRIYANKELENLKTVLSSLSKIINPGGKVAIISFHSLEDKIVKDYFREGKKKGELEILTKKPLTANREESAKNPRSRSAKLRIAKLIK